MCCSIARVAALVLLGPLLWSSPASATVNRCVDAQGNVTLTDRPCGRDEKKTEVETRSPSRSPDEPPDADGRMRQQMRQVDERIQLKVRDYQARCDGGDQKACKEAICARLMTEGASPGRYRDCSEAGGFRSTPVWAQTSKVSFDGSMSTTVSVVCLVNPKTLTLGGEVINVYNHLRLRKSNHANAYHEAERWSASLFEGPDYATWEEAADGLCRSVKGGR